MANSWKYLENQFNVSTKNNFKKAVKISAYHDAQLNTQKVITPALVPIYNRYHPLNKALNTAYDKWKSDGGSQEGQTLNMAQQLGIAVEKRPGWEVAVQNFFLKGTPQYKAVFPNGRKPFNSGTVDDRINSFNILALNMSPYADLAPIKEEVQEIYVAIDKARELQQGSKGTVKVSSNEVEDARLAAMEMQYRNLGFAMDNFSSEPDYIASLFDLVTLREKDQKVFTGTLDIGENKKVLVHTFMADDAITLKNDGNGAIKFYLASTANGINSSAIEVAANEEKSVAIAEFSAVNLSTHRYLTAINQSDSEATHYVVTLL